MGELANVKRSAERLSQRMTLLDAALTEKSAPSTAFRQDRGYRSQSVTGGDLFEPSSSYLKKRNGRVAPLQSTAVPLFKGYPEFERGVTKGYPEYDQTQPRGGDGRWSGGSGGGSVPMGPAQRLLQQNLKRYPTPTRQAFLNSLKPDERKYLSDVTRRLAGKPFTHDTPDKGGFRNADGTYTAERAKLHDLIIKTRLDDAMERAKPDDGEQPHVVIIGGRPASGKTPATRDSGFIADNDKYLYINADDLRGDNKRFRDGDERYGLPGYEGWNSSLYHAEASMLTDRLISEARELGLNIIHDATLRKAGPAKQMVDAYNDAGYRTSALFVHAPPGVTAYRVLNRAMRGSGRFVPTYILGPAVNERAFDAIRNKVDEWKLYDNAEWGSYKLVASGKRKRTKKGYPEFNPDQPRAEDGTWGGGVGARSLTLAQIKRTDIANLMPDERTYVMRYVGLESDRINGELRRDPAFTGDDVRALDKFTSMHTSAVVSLVYRGVKQPFAERLAKLSVGDVIVDPAYMSTSWHLPVAESAIGFETPETKTPTIGGKPAVMTITLSKGSRFGSLELMDGRQNSEHEILLPRGTRLRFDGKDASGRYPVYRFTTLARTEKGYPEYDPDQARGEDGQWTGGGSEGLTSDDRRRARDRDRRRLRERERRLNERIATFDAEQARTERNRRARDRRGARRVATEAARYEQMRSKGKGEAGKRTITVRKDSAPGARAAIQKAVGSIPQEHWDVIKDRVVFVGLNDAAQLKDQGIRGIQDTFAAMFYAPPLAAVADRVLRSTIFVAENFNGIPMDDTVGVALHEIAHAIDFYSAKVRAGAGGGRSTRSNLESFSLSNDMRDTIIDEINGSSFGAIDFYLEHYEPFKYPREVFAELYHYTYGPKKGERYFGGVMRRIDVARTFPQSLELVRNFKFTPFPKLPPIDRPARTRTMWDRMFGG